MPEAVSQSQTTPATDIRVLVVDDDEFVRRSMKRALVQLGYSVECALGGDEALEVLRGQEPFEIMLLDVVMPGLWGPDVLDEALEIDNQLAILMLSGRDEAATAALCLQRGALDYITKPVEILDLDRLLKRAARRRDTRIQSEGISTWLREEVSIRTRQLEAEREKTENLTVATLEALVNALEAKDPYSVGHSLRVTAMSATIAAEMSLPDEVIAQIRVAGRLHDIGTIGIRESVLSKKSALTPEEFEHVKQHVTIGADILAPLAHLGTVIGFVRGHHERWDGSGYPDGLAGGDIPIGARIIGTAEIYDALTTPRVYRSTVTPSDAIAEMQAISGVATDPDVIEALAAAVAKRQALVFIRDED